MKKLFMASLIFVSTASFAGSVKIQKPIEPDTKLPFSSQNVQRLDGVCKALGYQNYVFDTAKRNSFVEDAVLVNGDGLIVALPKFETIAEIECESDGSKPAQPEIATIQNPTDIVTGLPYSARNAQRFDSICKQFWYSGYVESSARRTGKVEDSVVLDNDRNIVITKDRFESIASLSCYL